MWLERLQTGTVAPGHHDNNRCWQTNRCHISLSRRPLCMCALACGCAGERERAGVYLSARERTGVVLFLSLSLLSCTHASVALSGDGWWTPSVHLHKLATYCNLVPAFSLSSPLSVTSFTLAVIFFLSYLILQSSSSFTFISCIFPFITFILPHRFAPDLPQSLALSLCFVLFISFC